MLSEESVLSDLRKVLSNLRQELIKAADPNAVQAIVNEQVDLLGSELLYERINQNLKQHRFESVFAREQCLLYSWRQDFFFKFVFANTNIVDLRTPYHITKNFDAVIALVCSDKLDDRLVEYFELNEEQSLDARVFDKEGMEVIAGDMQDLEEYDLGFNDAAQMIMALHRKGPPSLLESALKTVALHNLPLHEVPRELQRKALDGMYQLMDDIPDSLSPEGKELYEMLRIMFLETHLGQLEL